MQPLPDALDGQRLRQGTVPVWYPGWTAGDTTYSFDLSWAIRSKGRVDFWLKEDYAPAKNVGGKSYTTRISEAQFDCVNGTIAILKSWNYDTTGKASLSTAHQATLRNAPADRFVTLKREGCPAATP